MATEVEIEYCVPCGMLEPAQEVQRTLLETFGRDLISVCLVTGDGGVFVVRVDDDVVFDSDHDDEIFPDMIAERVEPYVSETDE